MINSVTATNDLDESVNIVLTEEEPSHGLLLTKIEGIGPVKATIATTDVATLDGSNIGNAKLDNRNIVFTFLLTGAPTIEDARQNIYKYFPVKKRVSLLFDTDNRLVETSGVVESVEPNIFSEAEDCTVSILCEDPYFYSQVEEMDFQTHAAIADWQGGIENDGDYEVGIVFSVDIIGDSGDLTLGNLSTGQIMKVEEDAVIAIAGSTFRSGDIVTLSTTRNNKKAILDRTLPNPTYNIPILNSLGRNPDWIYLKKGFNSFHFYSERNQKSSTSNPKILYRKAYGGI